LYYKNRKISCILISIEYTLITISNNLFFNYIQMTKQVWVSPNSNGGRRVHQSGSQRDSAHTSTKAEAVQRAESIARNQGLETKIQNRD
jgi:hypothetical protein